MSGIFLAFVYPVAMESTILNSRYPDIDKVFQQILGSDVKPSVLRDLIPLTTGFSGPSLAITICGAVPRKTAAGFNHAPPAWRLSN